MSIERESVALPSPDDYVRDLLLGFSLGGGMAVATDGGLCAFSRAEGSGLGCRLFAAALVNLSWRPSAIAAVQLRGGYIFSQHGYFPATRPNSSEQAERRSVPFSRFPIMVGISVFPSSRIAIGAGIGPIIEASAFSSDWDRAGKPQAILGAYAEFRVHVAHGFWLAAEPCVPARALRGRSSRARAGKVIAAPAPARVA